MQQNLERKHRSTASFVHGSPSTHTPSHHRASFSSHAHATTPSRIPRPPLTSPATTASYVSSRSPNPRQSNGSIQHHTPLAGAGSSLSRKRARPMSPSSVQSHTYSAPSVPAVSPFTPSAQSPAGWSYVTAAHIPVSPPPMINVEYDLQGGMDTPSLMAAKQYDILGEMDYTGDRLGRDRRTLQGPLIENEDMLNGDKNGRGRQGVRDVSMMDSPGHNTTIAPTAGWGGYVLGALGTVVAGAWEFCRKSAFNGFHAGDGQGYDLASTDEMIDSMWEDERDESLQHQQLTPSYTRSFSFERLPTPIPGRYPDDSPAEDDTKDRIMSPEKRPVKRRQTEGGEWTIIGNKSMTETTSISRASSPRLGSPGPAAATVRSRSHLRTQSATISRHSSHSLAPRHRRRVSTASISSPHTTTATSPSRRPSSRHSQSTNTHYLQAHSHNHHRHQATPPPSHSSSTSPLPTTTTTNVASILATKHTGPSSPLSNEARRYVSRRRKHERETAQRYDRLNDRLQEMIRQGKQALGTTIAVVDDGGGNDDDDNSDREMW